MAPAPHSRKEHSVFSTIFVSLLLALVIELTLLVGTIIVGQVPSQLDDNAEEILREQVENRSGYLQNFLISSQELTTLSTYINSQTEALLAKGTISLDTLDSGSAASEPLLRAISSELVFEMRAKKLSGIYVIFCSRDLDDCADGTRFPGIYVRDLDPDGYISNAKMLPTGHWMNRMDTLAFKWMGQFTRNPYPDKVVWKQDSTDLNKAMYWLSMPEEKLQLGGLIIVSHNGNEFIIERSYSDELTIGLNDKMIDYSKPVVVRYRGKEVFRGKVKRTVASLYKSYISRHDDRYGFSTVLNLKLD